jgi:hypothetical protein
VNDQQSFLATNWPMAGFATVLNNFLVEILTSGRFGYAVSAALETPELRVLFRKFAVDYLQEHLRLPDAVCVIMLSMSMQEFLRILFYFFVGAANEFNIGSFCDNNREVYELLQEVDLTVSGHSHRAGFYVVDEIKGTPLSFEYYHGQYNHDTAKYKIPEGVRINDDKIMNNIGDPPIKDVVLPAENNEKNACLVCGSSGPFSKQNLFGEFAGCGMALPQGMIIDPNNNNEVKVKIVNAVYPIPPHPTP